MGLCVQIISLGSHSIDADFEQAVLLMEIMPSLLAKRNFDPLNTLAQLEPGYRDSPEPTENMTIVFVKVCNHSAAVMLLLLLLLLSTMLPTFQSLGTTAVAAGSTVAIAAILCC